MQIETRTQQATQVHQPPRNSSEQWGTYSARNWPVCRTFLNNQEQGCTYDQGLKIRTVWVRVPLPLLEKDLQNSQSLRPDPFGLLLMHRSVPVSM